MIIAIHCRLRRHMLIIKANLIILFKIKKINNNIRIVKNYQIINIIIMSKNSIKLIILMVIKKSREANQVIWITK